LNETHSFGANRVNEARFGFNRIRVTFTPTAQLNPADFGINNGINEPIGLPQINVDGIGLNFGGPANFPSGRADTTWVLSDTVSYLRSTHGLKFGMEIRRFYQNSFNLGTGRFGFTTVPNFINGTAGRFSVTLGDRSSAIGTGAVGAF